MIYCFSPKKGDKMVIPKIFTTQTDITNWSLRRKEILKLFEDNIYGKMPNVDFDSEEFGRYEHLCLENGFCKDVYRLWLCRNNKMCGMSVELFYKNSSEPQPSIFIVDPFSNNPYIRPSAIERLRLMDQNWYIAAQGYICVCVHVDEMCFDDPDRCNWGFFELIDREGSNATSAISVWAWAMERVRKHLESNPLFDKNRMIVSGCSRAGKTALWCGANFEGFTGVFASVSGCSGAAMHRGKTGERIADITKQFPHWSCPKYAEYSDNEEALPVDQHMLLALIAPRPLYISSASEDDWACPKKEFESCVLAGEAYYALGKRGLASEEFPKLDSPIIGGDIQYHIRKGPHGVFMYDWEQVIPFFNREFI